MAYEIETKILGIDPDAIKEKLASLGGTKSQEVRLTVDWYRITGIKEGEDPWFLRIRSYEAQGIETRHEVTWKAKSQVTGNVRKHKEINFDTQSPQQLADLFEELGLERYAHQEKDRISFILKDCQFDIDQYPGMPAYMEIESPSEDAVNGAIKALGLEGHAASPEGERKLIQNSYGLDWYDMRF